MGRGEEFIERLRRGEVVVADGAMGTELLARGLAGAELDAAPIRHPAVVTEIHAAYLAAGAGLIRTATFSANGPRLSVTGLGGELEAINRAAVGLARAVAGDAAIVAGSMGPCFAPADAELSDADRESAHDEQAEVLADAGADLLVCETFTALRDCVCALRAALRTGLPVLAHLSLLKPATADGVDPGPALLTLAEIGAAAVGVNCGSGDNTELRAIRAARTLSPDLILTAFPNAGRPGCPLTAAAIADRAVLMRNAGARLIGGCCGTGPAGIAAVAAITARRR